VEQLVARLEDENKYVIQHAAKSLGRLGDQRAVKALTELAAESEGSTKNEAQRALWRITERGGVKGGPGKEVPETKVTEIDTVLSRIKDTAKEGVEWLIYEKRFVARKQKDKLRNFDEFMIARGIDSIKVGKLAFTEERVWAPTNVGAFCYERKSGIWVEYAVNRMHIGMPVDSIRVRDDKALEFAMKIEGKVKTYVFDAKSSSWAEGKGGTE
jgi:hypothetical protein